jgi:hypothetical protein
MVAKEHNAMSRHILRDLGIDFVVSFRFCRHFDAQRFAFDCNSNLFDSEHLPSVVTVPIEYRRI